MRFLRTFSLAVLAVLVAGRDIYRRQQLPIDDWIAKETPVALTGLFRNVGNLGEFARSVDAGAVIASPSTDSPNYFFQWTRDSSLVFKVILNEYINGNTSLESFLMQFGTEQAKLQHVDNPSGGFSTGGLGEPKFLVNGQAFTGAWGRPQTDGPALRAIVMIEFANRMLDAGNTDYVRSIYDGAFPTNSLIKADLEYVANNWQVNGFDLWEEVQGQHFFTGMVQQRALTAGAALANRLGDPGAATFYLQQATALKSQLATFWDSSKGFIVATLNNGRSGINCGTLLGSLHGNGAAGTGIFEPSSDMVLATHKALVDAFRTLYAINTASGAPGVAIGRYPEDVYDGVGTSQGNPWFICTQTAAELLYNAILEFNDAGSIGVTSISQAFFRQFLSAASAGSTYAAGSSEFSTIISGMGTFADSFLAVQQLHAMMNGSMSEQFSRNTGFQVGARDLTWSYGSFLTTAGARAGNVFF